MALVGLLGALIISLLADRRYLAKRRETIDLLEQIQAARERATCLSLSTVFWATLFALALAVVLRYALR